MKLDACFACPGCGERIQITGEYNEEEASWEFDIKAVEESSEE